MCFSSAILTDKYINPVIKINFNVSKNSKIFQFNPVYYHYKAISEKMQPLQKIT